MCEYMRIHAVADLGGAKGAVAPPFCDHRKHKRMHVLTLKHNKTAKFLHLVPFLHFNKHNSLDPPMGCTYHTPYFVNGLLKFENLINFA